MRLYDATMLGVTSYTKIGLRIATFVCFAVSIVSVVIALVYFVLKCLCKDSFVAGTAPILIGMLFLGVVQLIFMGIIGEYTLSIYQRLMNRPLVIEEKRLNFQTAV